MAGNLAVPKTLTRFSLSAKILNLQPFTGHDLINRSNIYNGTFNPESFFTSLLDRSTCRRHLNQIHSQIIVTGFQCNGFIVTKFIHVSSNVGEISYARQLFDEFPEPYVFLWNAIIRGYSKQNMFNEAITLYTRMQNVGVRPDCFTLPHVLKACGGAAAFEVGQAVHGQIFRGGFERDVFVQNGVVAVAYADIEDLAQGKSLHSCVIKMGLEFEPDLRIALTTLYAKCGSVMIAKSLFDEMEISNVIMWNAMISGFAKNGCCNKAITLFQTMLSKNLRPDSVTVCSAILACAQLGSLEEARKMGEYIDNSIPAKKIELFHVIVFMWSLGHHCYAGAESLAITKPKHKQTQVAKSRMMISSDTLAVSELFIFQLLGSTIGQRYFSSA
ncbi:hypothetical protein L6452_17473 [Arctium lappa]|uniref:Uncharacterized protein n=1 Tax=Arctium lappa TaxID=4217 RepID=A0ACB9C3P1_ARCLA|nr:hypothetical protein L6452_17473 [Arctium lappa]